MSPSCPTPVALVSRNLGFELRRTEFFPTRGCVFSRRADSQSCRCASDASGGLGSAADEFQEKLELLGRGEVSRSAGLALLDEELRRGNDRGALSLARVMAKSIILRGFGGASQVCPFQRTAREKRKLKQDSHEARVLLL